MTPTDIIAATDEMFSRIKAGWDAGIDAIHVGAELRFPSAPNYGTPPPVRAPWARVVQTGVIRQKAYVGHINNKLPHRETGLIGVQIFVPIGLPNAFTLGQKLGKLISNSLVYPTSDGAVNFKDSISVQGSDTEQFKRWDVTATYTFDEMV